MTAWDLLDDEPEPVPEPPKKASASIWASLDEDEPQPSGEPAPTRSTWQSLDDDEPEPAAPPPAPELTASVLSDGEVLWARADGQSVTLGSGQPLHVPAGVPDGVNGWRRVRILDAATLHAEVLVFPVEQPAAGVADEPAALFAAEPAPSPPLRPPGFPAGEGGDLTAAFEARVRRAEQDHRNAAAAALEDYRRRGDQLERQLREEHDRRSRAAEQRAEAQYHEAVRQVRQEAEQQVRHAQQVAAQNHDLRRGAEQRLQAATTELDKVRGERGVGLAVAAAGWGVALILLIIAIAT
ncbi:hypothetical protein [Actinomadura verrucosospora]|uniref:Uncharacterized protein n=1 Tax=Actinomadura verrucosospora TaxID=46165 RepID=A0A7D3ZZ80_ACTVE|nr:hypothetical protein [Actinomadura verrucosospora]QKG18625.1 hypothetical protein ACTIVE_0259 [Actinomadura verrucosospora]